jgi:acyl-CoA hydrolase
MGHNTLRAAGHLWRQRRIDPSTCLAPMSSITLRFLAEPGAVNSDGKVRGGTVMNWTDEAGHACATRWARRYCVTVPVGRIRFQRPVMVGDLVEVQARLAYTGLTSMNISVDVRSGDIKTGAETPGDIALAQHVKNHLDVARTGRLRRR